MENTRNQFKKITAINIQEIESWLVEQFENVMKQIHSNNPKEILHGLTQFELLHELRIKCDINRPHGVISTNDYIKLKTLCDEMKHLFQITTDPSIIESIKNDIKSHKWTPSK